ncbi:MAG: ABC transporter ATP-binding protein [Candidatus Woesebacteria bacterium]|nr:ABC transporter ATP-binding protein [Candidatus Woesebacteria bacterium]
MKDSVITIKNLSKEYIIDPSEQYYHFRDYLVEAPRRLLERIRHKTTKEKFWALRNINLSLKKGEVLGVIGRNGAGKSTLLKILARITPPTKGSVTIKGRVATMLEVGTGFNPELTGRENVFLNGAILGMTRNEIKNKFNKIVDFSEIGKFLDIPVKKYSTGMQVRLAFSVAAHVEPEVLLLDEVLAVGDLSFQRKSLAKMQSIAKNDGTTVIFVSHNLTAIDALCSKVALIEEGEIKAIGKPQATISKYITDFVPQEQVTKDIRKKPRTGNGKLRVVDFWIENENGRRVSIITSGTKVKFVFKYNCPSGYKQKNVDFGFGVRTEIDQPVFIHYLSFTNQQLNECSAKGKFIFEFPKLPLAKGLYKIAFRTTVDEKESDYVFDGAQFNVEDGDFYNTGLVLRQSHSPIFVEGKWTHTE